MRFLSSCLVTLCGFIFLGAGLVGCSPSYVPPDNGATTALIKGKEGMVVSGVDGKDTGAVSVSIPLSMFSNEVRVSAGPHSISATSRGNNSSAKFTFFLDCLADHIYTVEPKDWMISDVVVRDTTSGTVVKLEIPRSGPTTVPSEPPK